MTEGAPEPSPVSDTGRAAGPSSTDPHGANEATWRLWLRRLRRYVGEGRSPIWVELLLIVWLCWIYDDINNLSPLRTSQAMHNAGDFLHFEKILHLDPEAAMDHWLNGHMTLATIVANYYDNAHFVVTLGLIGLLWWKWPAVYRPLRNSLVMANLIGMAVFWLVPTAPPRLYDPSVYYDVVANTHAFGSWHTGALATAADQLAAMPSLHLTWAAWSALAMWRILPHRWWRWAVWIYPLLTALAVLSTGNHFLTDVVAGILLLVITTWIADHWAGWWTARQARRALEHEGVVVELEAAAVEVLDR